MNLMMRFLAFFAFFLVSVLQVQAQREYIHRFENLHANTRFFGFYKMAPAPDGGWAVAGCDSATGVIQVLRFDSCGDIYWSKNLEAVLSPRPSRCSDLFFDHSGQLVVGAVALGSSVGFFFVFKLAEDGTLRWTRSWQADRFGFGVFSMGAMPSGNYFFTGTNNTPAGPKDFVGVLDTSGDLQTVRTYFRSSQGHSCIGIALQNGHLLVRRGPVWYEIDPMQGTVFWVRSLGAPLFNHCIPLELEQGFLVIGQFSDSQNLYSGVPVFFDPDGKVSRLGDMFRANGGTFSNTTNMQIRRVSALPDGNFVTVTTDSLPRGYVSVVVFSPDGTLIQQTLINPSINGAPLFSHDYCLLPDGTLAIAANAGGCLAVIKTLPVTNLLCDALPHKYPVPYQNFLSENAISITVDTFPFEPLLLPFSISEHDPGRVVWCDDKALLPDLDTFLEACPGDSTLADAKYPGATKYSWENGSDAAAVYLRPGQERVATVTIGCDAYRHRFISTIKSDCPCPLIIPNAFTPDLDGINDVFLPVNTCGFSEFRLSVFNRWGQLVFFSDQPGSGWDGTFDGVQVPSDVYVFVLDFRADVPDATVQRRKGGVTLLR
jgi:gliding motility-associated-like protein